jgi:glycine C-acetyltransferase
LENDLFFLTTTWKTLKNSFKGQSILQQNKTGVYWSLPKGVFGMSGDLGKLDQIVKLREKYPFRLLVDDAHGFGTMGKTGAGVAEHLGVQDEVDVYFGTFAKGHGGDRRVCGRQ